MNQEIKSLYDALEDRFPVQLDAENILPPENIDFSALKTTRVKGEDSIPNVERTKFSDHERRLRFKMSGRSELFLLHALVISYLRRDTPHTAKAEVLFHRLWNEEKDYLLHHLSMRWLISALQTFYDHPRNDEQRLIGAVGFMFANLVKVYEAERSCHPETAIKQFPLKWKSESFFNLEFAPGDDILKNINLMALSVTSRDGVAGSLLEKVIVKINRRDTIFRRVDDLRNSDPFYERNVFYSSMGGVIPRGIKE